MGLKARFQWIKQHAQWIKDSKKAKKDKLYAKKSFLGEVQGEWFLNIFLLTWIQFWFLLLRCFLYRFPDPPIPRGSLTLYILISLILTLHLLIMHVTTWVFIPSNALPSLLWVTATKTTLFWGLLHINTAKGFGEVQSMSWQLPSLHVRANPLSKALSPQCGPPLVMCPWRGSGSPLQLYRPNVWAPRNYTGLLGLGYDIWHYHLIKFLYPTISFTTLMN